MDVSKFGHNVQTINGDKFKRGTQTAERMAMTSFRFKTSDIFLSPRTNAGLWKRGYPVCPSSIAETSCRWSA